MKRNLGLLVLITAFFSNLNAQACGEYDRENPNCKSLAQSYPTKVALGVVGVELSIAHSIESVIGEGRCGRYGVEALKIDAENDARIKCKSEVVQISKWEDSTVSCYGPGHAEWDGLHVEALFECQTWH